MKSKQDVINKVDELAFVLNEIKTNSTDEPLDYQSDVDAVQAVIDSIKKATEPKAKP